MLKATNEISHADEYEHIIINDNFEQSLLTLRSIILANRATRKNILEQVENMFPKP